MINEITLLVTILFVILLFFVPKKMVLVVFVTAACFVPADQRIILVELDFTVLRILVLTMILRAWSYNEVRFIRWTSLDKVFLAWALARAVVYIMQWRSIGSMIYQSGALLDILGLYWLVRQYLSSWDDIRPVAITLACCVLVLLPLVVMESATGVNPFTVLGQVRTAIRDAETRTQGPFPHSILLGLFWATTVPLFWAMIKGRRMPLLFWMAVGASIIIAFCTRSSTPILTIFTALGLMQLYSRRHLGKKMAWAFGALLVALHIGMNAPVWHLFARVGVIGGSTGYHRYKLIDNAVRHFREWALLGTRSTAHWGYGMNDLTNQYIFEGVMGGALTLALFLWVLGKAIRITWRYSLEGPTSSARWLGWGFCISVIAHGIAFFGVSYFGQSRMLFYLTMAMAGMVAEMQMAHKTALRRPHQVSAVARGSLAW